MSRLRNRRRFELSIDSSNPKLSPIRNIPLNGFEAGNDYDILYLYHPSLYREWIL
jgi:hypothetical protein